MTPTPREQFMADLAAEHEAWTEDWQHLPVPEGLGEDPALHHVDAGEHAEASDDFERRIAKSPHALLIRGLGVSLPAEVGHSHP